MESGTEDSFKLDVRDAEGTTTGPEFKSARATRRGSNDARVQELILHRALRFTAYKVSWTQLRKRQALSLTRFKKLGLRARVLVEAQSIEGARAGHS